MKYIPQQELSVLYLFKIYALCEIILYIPCNKVSFSCNVFFHVYIPTDLTMLFFILKATSEYKFFYVLRLKTFHKH